MPGLVWHGLERPGIAVIFEGGQGPSRLYTAYSTGVGPRSGKCVIWTVNAWWSDAHPSSVGIVWKQGQVILDNQKLKQGRDVFHPSTSSHSQTIFFWSLHPLTITADRSFDTSAGCGPKCKSCKYYTSSKPAVVARGFEPQFQPGPCLAHKNPGWSEFWASQVMPDRWPVPKIAAICCKCAQFGQ